MALADLEFRNRIASTADELLQECEAFFQIAGVKEVFQRKNDFGRKQVRSLLDAAGSAFSPRELKAYIRYKVGRGNGWETLCDGLSLGERLCESISRVEDLAARLFPGDTRAARILVEKFLGYVYWQGSSLVAAGHGQGNGRELQQQHNGAPGTYNSRARKGDKYRP